MTTKTIHTLKVEADTIKRNLMESFIDLLHDDKGEDLDVIEGDFNRMTDSVFQLNRGNFGPVFAEGYTMMLLDPKDFREVEDFFREYDNNDQHTLEIVVTDKNGRTLEVVPEDSISY